MNGVDLHIVLEPAPSAGWSPETVPEVEDLGRLDESDARVPPPSPPPAPRLVVVMLALSGHLDTEEPGGDEPTPRDRSDGTLERLAMLGISFGL